MGENVSITTVKRSWMRAGWFRVSAGLVLIGSVVAWAYWPTLWDLVGQWSRDPQYTHGYLVPLFSVALLWLKRADLRIEKLRPSWWGLPILAGAVAIRSVGAYYSILWLDAISLLPCLAGLVLLLGGWHALKWSGVAIGFLFFTIPLPYFLEASLSYPLRRVATVWSTYCLQFAGLPALAEGHQIVIGHFRMEVAEACSGLSMLMTFFALTVAFICVVEPPLWKRIVILASAVPIAVLANVVRITATGILHEVFDEKVSTKVFHDWAGIFMMPVALLMLMLELWYLSHLFKSIPLSGPPSPARILGLRGQPRGLPSR